MRNQPFSFHMQDISDWWLLLSIYSLEPFLKIQHIHHTYWYKKGSSQVIGKSLFNVHWYYHYSARLYFSRPHVILRSLNRHLLPLEDTYGQGCFSLSPFKDLREVLNLIKYGVLRIRQNSFSQNSTIEIIGFFNKLVNFLHLRRGLTLVCHSRILRLSGVDINLFFDKISIFY